MLNKPSTLNVLFNLRDYGVLMVAIVLEDSRIPLVISGCRAQSDDITHIKGNGVMSYSIIMMS